MRTEADFKSNIISNLQMLTLTISLNKTACLSISRFKNMERSSCSLLPGKENAATVEIANQIRYLEPNPFLYMDVN